MLGVRDSGRMGSHTCRRNPCTAAFKFWSNVFSMIALMLPLTKLLGLPHLMTALFNGSSCVKLAGWFFPGMG
jgi:hypothetical protein